MKHRITLHCDRDGLFTALTGPFIESYEEVKKRKPSETELERGLAFQTRVASDPKHVRYANVKVLKYKRPEVFSSEYRSETYHKVTTFTLEEVDAEHTTLIYEMIEEKIRNGAVVQTRGDKDPDKITGVPLLERRKYLNLATAVRKKKI